MAHSNSNLEITVVIQAPRGRPPKHSSKRLRRWYERGCQTSSKSASTFIQCVVSITIQHRAASLGFDGEDVE